MGSTGKRYNQEFKDSAIQLALNSASTIVQISKDLNIMSTAELKSVLYRVDRSRTSGKVS